MSKDADYLRAEVSRAQKEGAKHVLVRVPEIHAILARIAELERRKAEQPTGGPVQAGFVSIELLEGMMRGESKATTLERAKTEGARHAVYFYRPAKDDVKP